MNESNYGSLEACKRLAEAKDLCREIRGNFQQQVEWNERLVVDNAALRERLRVVGEALREIASGNRTAHECINWARQAIEAGKEKG